MSNNTKPCIDCNGEIRFERTNPVTGVKLSFVCPTCKATGRVPVDKHEIRATCVCLNNPESCPLHARIRLHQPSQPDLAIACGCLGPCIHKRKKLLRPLVDLAPGEAVDKLIELMDADNRAYAVRILEDLLQYQIDAWVGDMPDGNQHIEPVVQKKMFDALITRLKEGEK